jgi:hypothetical protein
MTIAFAVVIGFGLGIAIGAGSLFFWLTKPIRDSQRAMRDWVEERQK